MKARTVLAGWGAGILVSFQSIWPQLSPSHNAAYHSHLPNETVIWAVLIDWAVVSLLAMLLFGYVEGNASGSRNWIWAPVAAAFASAILSIYPTVTGRSIPYLHIRLHSVVGIILVSALALRWLWPRAYQTAGNRLATVLVLVGCSVVWMAPELVYLGLRPHALRPPGAAQTMGTDGPSPASRSRIVWLLFDEMSYNQTFEHRFPGLSLPAFDQLAHSSFLFEDVEPVGYYTELAVPSLLLGFAVDSIRSDLDGNPSIKIAGEKGWRRFDAQSTLFAEAQRNGWTTGVAGWYNPYCRILAGTLDFCYAKMLSDPEGMTSENSVLRNAASPVTNWIRLLKHRPSLLAEQHDAELQAFMPQAQALLRDETIRFVFIHLPVPHPPGIYDRRRKQTRPGGTYIDNLDLADRLLGEMMETLSTTASAAETTLIVCSDHSWRVPMWKAAPGWTKEEQAASGSKFDIRPLLMIHFPAQSTEARVTQPFDEIMLHEILVRMLRGELRSPAQLLE